METDDKKDPEHLLKTLSWRSEGNSVDGNSDIPGRRREREVKSGYDLRLWEDVSLRLEAGSNVSNEGSSSWHLFTDWKAFLWVMVAEPGRKLEKFKETRLGGWGRRGTSLIPWQMTSMWQQPWGAFANSGSSLILNRSTAENGVFRKPRIKVRQNWGAIQGGPDTAWGEKGPQAGSCTGKGPAILALTCFCVTAH